MKLQLVVSNYTDNNRIAIGTICRTEYGTEPYSHLTVNLTDETTPFDTDEVAYGFIDTNNWAEGEEFIKKHELGEDTGFRGHSGFCTYPLYRFDKQKLVHYAHSNKELEL